MSVRANYFFIWENGQGLASLQQAGPRPVQILSWEDSVGEIIKWLLGGPTAFLESTALIRSKDWQYKLLDENEADAGLFYDEPGHKLLFFLPDEYSALPLRRLILPAIRRRWPGWWVDWAEGGIMELIDEAGLVRKPVQQRYAPFVIGGIFAILRDEFLQYREPDPMDTTRDLDSCDIRRALEWHPRPREISTMLTIRTGQYEVRDVALPYVFTSLLGLRPVLLEWVDQKEPDWLPLPAENAHGGSDKFASCTKTHDWNAAVIYGGLYIDEPAKAIWVWSQFPIDNHHLSKCAIYWPGWQLRRLAGGWLEHLALTGRDPAPYALSHDELRTWLEQLRFKNLLLPLLDELT